jgi:hypothetical protein
MMTEAEEVRSDRVKFVYNAQFPSPNAVVLDYLLNNPHFTSRQGRQQGMDAIAAFYRPMAEEAVGDLPEAEVQEIARHCVEVLAKQIDALCGRYKIDNPLTASGQATIDQGDFGKLEAVLEQGLQAIASALHARSFSTDAALTSGYNATSSLDIEQGVIMDGDELGELGKLLNDPDSLNSLVA